MVRPAALHTVPLEIFSAALPAELGDSAWAPVPQHASCATFTFERTNADAVVTFRVRWRTEDGIETPHSQIDGTLVTSAAPLIDVAIGIVQVSSFAGVEPNFDYTVAIPPNKAEVQVQLLSVTEDPGDARVSVSFA